MPLLEVKDVAVRYDKAVVLNGVSLSVEAAEFVGLVGPNGAGKSTLLRAISGLVRLEVRLKRGTEGDIALEGEVWFAGERIDALPAHEIRRRGLVHCPDRRRPFRELTVLENLMAGAYLETNKNKTKERLQKVYDLFPVLKDRSNQISGTLSGGEQQMLAIGRALMSEPQLLCIDEPSTGLSPILRQEVFEKIVEIKRLGITILLVEQEVSTVFKLASRNYVLSSGKMIAEGTGEEILK